MDKEQAIQLCEFLSRGCVGYKPCFIDMQWRSASEWSTSIFRYWNADSREKIIERLQELATYLRDYPMVIGDTVEGIKSLEKTYSDDKNFCERLSVIVEELDSINTEAILKTLEA